GRRCAGAVAIGKGSTEACIRIIGRATPANPGRKFVTQVSGAVSGPPKGFLGTIAVLVQMLWFSVTTRALCAYYGVASKFVWGSAVVKDEEAMRALMSEFLPEALARGEFVAAPEPQVVGHGLESIQTAFDVLAKGVSAKKVVVTL
ncbi:hypothetical protein HK405_009853, partial [Cladochytrium tenue]